MEKYEIGMCGENEFKLLREIRVRDLINSIRVGDNEKFGRESCEGTTGHPFAVEIWYDSDVLRMWVPYLFEIRLVRFRSLEREIESDIVNFVSRLACKR